MKEVKAFHFLQIFVIDYTSCFGHIDVRIQFLIINKPLQTVRRKPGADNIMFIFLKKQIQLIGVLSILCLSANSGYALNLDQLFPQKIDEKFYEKLRANAGDERAVFVTFAGQEKILYLRYVDGQFVLRGRLSADEEAYLTPEFFQSASTIFAPLKQNGSPLYSKGFAYSGTLPGKAGDFAQFIYVPHQISGKANDAFVCDCGYLQVNMPAAEQQKVIDLSAIIKALFAGQAEIRESVKLNRYYLYRDNFFGPIDAIDETRADEILFPPLHKATLNKAIADSVQKTGKDQDLVISLLARERFLYSQDTRLKLGLVPGFVEIQWRSLDNTDIGSGQNQLVFLSSGPGINYFDDPWLRPRANIPCPRLIFHRNLCRFESLQVFPTYSIEPKTIGEGRLHAINSFQTNQKHSSANKKAIIWSSDEFKNSYFPAIEEALCRYGLANDNSDLAPGFDFAGKFFNGNLVNNEIRALQSVPVRDMLTAVIVPSGSALAYSDSYKRELAGSSPHWDFNCGIHYRQLFTEAATSTDKGFRATWLLLQLKDSHPVLYRIIKRAQAEGKITALLLLADRASKMAARAGRKFFLTPYFKHWRSLDDERNQKWLEYLEAYRNGDAQEAAELLQRFKAYYQYLESVIP